MSRKKRAPKERSFEALQAWHRTGAGPHRDKRRKRDKRVDLDD